MSRASKLTLAGTSLFAIGTVFFVHFQQKAEKSVCCSSLSSPHQSPALRKLQLTFLPSQLWGTMSSSLRFII